MENPYQAPRAGSDPVRLEPIHLGRRPTSVTVFGIVNIVFGSLGLACTPAWAFWLFTPVAAGAARNPTTELMRGETYRGVLIASIILSWIASGVLLAAGIGLLKERSWGRKLSVGYGVYSIAAQIVAALANFLLLVRPLMEAARHDRSPEATSAATLAVVSNVGGLVGLVFPVLLLVFMTRPYVVAFLERPRPADPDYFRMTPV